mgnify:CR=1 FL=1
MKVIMEQIKKETKKSFSFEDVTKNGDFYHNKEFRKRASTIFVLNIVIFAILCTCIFVVIFLPILMWLYSKNDTITYDTFMEYLTTCVLVGGPIIVATALYGGLLFWVLLVRVIHFEHEGHKIDIYLGVKSIAFAVDGKLIGYAQHGIYAVPHVVWYTKINNSGIRLEVFKKNDYRLDINWYPVTIQKQDINLHADKSVSFGTHKTKG